MQHPSKQEPRVCVVAGVGPGIGLAVAQRFARENYTVVLLARRTEALEGYAAAIDITGRGVRCYSLDLGDHRAIASTFDRIAGDVGAPSVLIYNAATWNAVDPMTMDPGAFTADLALCATGALACVQAVYSTMKRRREGTILFTGGGLALRPEFGAEVISLTAGKCALRGLTFALAPTLEAFGIHVGTVTVAGIVSPNTAFDPKRIADTFWNMHAQTGPARTREVVFDGK